MERASTMKPALSAALLLVILMTSCFTGNIRETGADLSIAGFLNDDCFQSVLEFPPDPDAQGLVKSRESAMKKAESTGLINWMVLDRLTEYRLDRALSVSGTDNAKMKESLRESLRTFLSYGKVEYSYFREDNAAVLIHRIRRKGLRGRIENIGIPTDGEKTNTK